MAKCKPKVLAEYGTDAELQDVLFMRFNDLQFAKKIESMQDIVELLRSAANGIELDLSENHDKQ